jgi:hypothetical protein
MVLRRRAAPMSMPDRVVRICGYLARPVDLFDARALASRSRVARVPTAMVVIGACVFFARPTADLMMDAVRQRGADFAATAERTLVPTLCESDPHAKRTATSRSVAHCRP